MPNPTIDAIRFTAPVGKDLNKPLFVYLPGMDGSGELFHLQSPGLQPYFDIRCLMIPTNDRSSWEVLANRVIALIAQEATPTPVYLCGESFGACLALQVIARAPDLVSHLILINSASSFYRFPWLRWVGPLAVWVAPSLYQASTLGSLHLLANLPRIQRPHQTALLKAMGAVSQMSVVWRLTLLTEFRLEDLPLQKGSFSTLLVASQADRLLPSVDEAQRLAALLPNSHIYRLPNSGHISLLEDGVSLGTILKAVNFLPVNSYQSSLVLS